MKHSLLISPPAFPYLGDSDLRERSAVLSLESVVRAVARLHSSLGHIVGRRILVARMTKVRLMRLGVLFKDLELAFIDVAQHSAWLETALMGEAGHQEMTGVLGEDEWRVLGAHRRQQLAEGLFAIQEGRRLVAECQGFLGQLEARLRDRENRKRA